MSIESLPRCPQCGTPVPEKAPDGLCPRCLMALNLKTETALSGEPAAAQAPLPPGEIAPHFPQFEILECLGRGGMGVVYRARQKTLNRLVALKLLAPERVSDPKFAARFAREARALAALNHPNIVTVYDFGQAGGFYYLLMEFVDGVNLRRLLRGRKFTPEEALAVVPPLCDALQFAHEHGIVHRDIKPENLLLDKTGRIKIADFGIAKMLGAGPEGEAAGPENATHSAAGTRGYTAPEQQAEPQKADSRADIYSLGVVFYEMLTGELPGQRIEPPSKKVQIDVRLDHVVLRALEKSPELRWQTAAELRTQVETIATTPRRAPETKEPSTGRQGGFGAAPAARTGSVRAASVALGLAVLTIILPLIAYSLRLPGLKVLFLPMFAAAVAAIVLGVQFWKSARGKGAVIVGCFALLAWMGFAFGVPFRLGQSKDVSVKVHHRVFDSDPALVDRLIPASQRRPGVQTNATFFSKSSSPSNFTVTVSSGESNYSITTPILEADTQIAEITPETLRALSNDITAAPAVEDRAEMVRPPWSRVGKTHAWSASHANQDFQFYVSGVGEYRFHDKRGELHAHVEALVNITSDPTEGHTYQRFKGRCLFDGKAPGGLLTFLIPFKWHDGTPRYLVIAYALDKQPAIPRAGPAFSTIIAPKTPPAITTAKGEQLSAEVGTNRFSALLSHDDTNAHYLLLYAGEFSLTSRQSPNSSQARLNDGRIALRNGRVFDYSIEPSMLRVSGWGFQFANGRVFTLSDDGTLEQLRLFPSLAQARDLAGLVHLIQEGRAPVIAKRAAGQVNSRYFGLRHKTATQLAERLGDILQNRPDCQAKVEGSNRRLTVIAPADVMKRVATFIVVEDWPDHVQDTPEVEAAKRFFRECSREDVARVSHMLSADVLAELAGTNLLNTVGAEAAAADAALTRQLHGDWPGKEAAIKRVIAAYNRYALSRIRHDDGGPNASIVFSRMPVIEFEGAPEEFGRMTFATDAEYGAVINRLPPWFSKAEEPN